MYSLRGAGAGANSVSISAGVLVNGSGGATRRLLGNGSAASSATFTTGDLYPGEFSGATSTANTFGNQSIYIPNYRSSVAKCISFDAVSENNGTEAYQVMLSGLSVSTDPVTSITLRVYGASANIVFAAGSSATLYGINRTSNLGRANYAPKATGGSIIYSNGFWYHVFRGSGSFVPQSSFNAEYLLVAGGGGGGSTSGSCSGAGGGGGGINAYSLAVTPQTYTVTVGAGGGSGTTGSSSSFGAQTLTGGGGGGSAGGGGGAGGLNAGSGAGGNCGGNGSNGGDGPSTFTSWAFPSMTGQTSGTLAYYSGELS